MGGRQRTTIFQIKEKSRGESSGKKEKEKEK